MFPDETSDTDRNPRYGEAILEKSRYLVAIPVVLLLLATLGAFVYGIVLFVDSVRHVVEHSFPVGANEGYFVLLIDVSLVGATTLIAAFGFYELFLTRDPTRRERQVLPRWLVISDLNDLKVRVLSMIVLVTAVTFLDVFVDFENAHDVLYLGAGAGAIIVAVTIFIRFAARDE